jgi:hypothetical protein
MATSELRLPPFFPASPAPCKAEADAFFAAFTAASVYAGDKVRAPRALGQGAAPAGCAASLFLCHTNSPLTFAPHPSPLLHFLPRIHLGHCSARSTRAWAGRR